MTSPKVSIIMPVYNAQARLPAALDCALSQSIKDFEFIAINDGSTDDSGKILKEYAQKFPQNMRVIECENSGAARARNKGLSLAKGQWIYFCDSDDEFAPDICQYLVNLAESSNSQIASCAMQRLANGKVSLAQNLNCETCKDLEIIGKEEVLKRWLLPLFRIKASDRNASHGYLPLCVFKREIIEKNNITFAPDIAVHEDESFFLQYLNFVNRAALSKKILYSYIFCDTSASVKFFKKTPEAFKVETNYYLAYKMRRIFWQKYMQDRPDFKLGLCELYAAELNHRLLAQTAEKSVATSAIIKKIGEIFEAEKSQTPWQIMFANSAILARKKRLFLKAIKCGKIATFLLCKLLLWRKTAK